MSKKPNHNADIKNPNTGKNGTNTTYVKNQGNKGKQLNPNQSLFNQPLTHPFPLQQHIDRIIQ